MKYIVYLYERIEKSEHEWDLSMLQAELDLAALVCAPRLI